MSGTNSLSISSEIGKLRSVLLHRPGKELERLTPAYLEEMLFDDIPWLKQISFEHDDFASVLRNHNCEVLYYSDLLADILKDKNVKSEVVDDVISFSHIQNPTLVGEIVDHLSSKTNKELSEIIISGLAISDLPGRSGRSRLSDYINEAFPFYISPLINLYFTRDPGAVIGDRMLLSSMKTEARRRESLILHHINKFHPRFADNSKTPWNSHTNPNSIEGGDVLVLSPETIAIGCSVRTSTSAIEEVAESLFKGNSTVKEVLVIQIPFTRAYMHLDTVLTMVDYDKFTIFPGIENSVKVFSIRAGEKSGLNIKPVDSLLSALKVSLKLPSVKLIPSGGGDIITAAREQWNDSTNTLAIAPGVVVTYDRNTVSNDTLRSNGIEVVEIGGSELVRGRGGPRCMSMPLNRDAL
ncbi:MAG: arginine deiminase [Spirochaetales bacterium]|nr:arginine deiminase [Spirochaetales bacterium]